MRMKKLNLLIIAHNYWPENFPINNVTQMLYSNNINIDVLTGQPNYPKGIIYNGYRAFSFKKEKYNNVNIYRVPIFPRKKGKSINMILNYLSFVFSAVFFGFIIMFKKKYDLILVYAPSPIIQSLIGIFFSKIKNIKVITWVQDLWPDVLISTGHIKNKFILRTINRIVNFIYKNNDLLLVQSNQFKNIIERRVKNVNVKYLPNPGNDKYLINKTNNNRINNLDNLKYQIENSFSIVYAGNIGKAQSIQTLVKSSIKLKKYKNIKIFLIGTGSEYDNIKKNALDLNLKNIVFTNYIDEIDLINLLNISSILYISLVKDEILNSTIPSKFQNYLACGRPILASINGETAEIIQNSRSGIVCEPENDIALADAIINLSKMNSGELNEMGLRGKQYFMENFHPKIIIKKLIKEIKNNT